MKKVALSNMKCAALFAMMFFSYQGMAQTASPYSSQYIGENCKIYPNPSEYTYVMLVAHLVTDEHHSSAKYLMADELTLLGDDRFADSKTKILTSKYGNYVEFYDVNSNSFKIFDNKFAFTINGSSLYYVGHNSYSFKEYGLTITTDLEIADDFQIIYHRSLGRFYIKNNGILSEYRVNDLYNTSVNSPKVDEIEDATYSIDGKKVQTLHNGIFIKGDKKVMIK